MKKKILWRKNVLYLMTLAYVVLLIIFVVISCQKTITAIDAWNMLEAPLMALIGGTLAISKDLIAGDDSSPSKNSGDLNTSPDETKDRPTNQPRTENDEKEG